MFRWEAARTNFIVFGLTDLPCSRLAHYYPPDVVPLHLNIILVTMKQNIIKQHNIIIQTVLATFLFHKKNFILNWNTSWMLKKTFLRPHIFHFVMLINNIIWSLFTIKIPVMYYVNPGTSCIVNHLSTKWAKGDLH